MKNLYVLNGQKVTSYLFLSVIGIVLMFAFAFVSIANAAVITRSLDLGSTGADVTSLQTYLATDPSIYPSGLVTGYYGQLTKAAVERFQTREGIVTSGTPATTGYGRVGPLTRVAINAKMSGSVGTNNGGNSPSISSPLVSTSNTSANLSWTTNENSSSVLYYSTSPIQMTEASPTTGVYVGGSSMLVNTSPQTSHATTLTGLSPNTNYNYVVYVRDVSGNESITWPSVFRTSN